MSTEPAAAHAAQTGNIGDLDRVLGVLLWADEQIATEERFIYFVQDVLRNTVRTNATREVFASALDQQAFGKMAGYIEYLTSREVVMDMATRVRAAMSGRRRIRPSRAV